ncbi:GNAT family N-acetyltransferase [Actinokineospora diospyrosa]|uniref:Ribosomal protein S18 acetylase RimI n=1 Tax=Actinokineospora diospyrosa TaxID=103728 RepID=A0ABT1IAP6_9PSEU|nr:GNAT family N-acetyltransferase [Actinokineospora diospyrosa]MCP2269727.1 Ribosomal protein S18 acetylase RimI [Actinokineospora diospyrosa]
MIVRLATDADIASVAALRLRAAEEDAEDAGEPITDPGYTDRFTEWWHAEKSHRRFWIAETGHPIGFCCLVLVTRMPKAGQPAGAWGYLSNFFVLPEHRDAGVGAALMSALLKYAEDLGCPRVVLTPSERAVPFYRRAGFSPAESLLLKVNATE